MQQEWNMICSIVQDMKRHDASPLTFTLLPPPSPPPPRRLRPLRGFVAQSAEACVYRQGLMCHTDAARHFQKIDYFNTLLSLNSPCSDRFKTGDFLHPAGLLKHVENKSYDLQQEIEINTTCFCLHQLSPLKPSIRQQLRISLCNDQL